VEELGSRSARACQNVPAARGRVHGGPTPRVGPANAADLWRYRERAVAVEDSADGNGR
jgi:hypothetical protein